MRSTIRHFSTLRHAYEYTTHCRLTEVVDQRKDGDVLQRLGPLEEVLLSLGENVHLDALPVELPQQNRPVPVNPPDMRAPGMCQ
jgi:hypothetical protein